jgi:hypothetical protein
MTRATVFWCALLFVGCRGDNDFCPKPGLIAEPQEIPSGQNQTALSVEISAFTGFETVTELTAENGSIADRFARQTTYTCAYDASGPVEICVNATYSEVTGAETSEGSGVGASYEYLRKPHVRLPNPLECSETRCIEVVCPEEKNACPVITSFAVQPMVLGEGETATIELVAEDPDDNPESLSTTLSARHGTILDPNATTTTYACDPDVGGVIEICVLASDGDSSCDVERCSSVQCPGEPLENTCPIIESLSATPTVIPVGDATTTVRVDAMDPDDFPVPLRIELSSETGVFDDRFSSNTTFTCGDSGPVQICAKANDGDPDCDETSCITVQCPSDIPPNLCPQLFIINGVPRVVPSGQTSTQVQTRGQDTDGLPQPLTLTLNALWGTFENTENILEPRNVVAQNAIYVCDRPGRVEVCVDATDGACTKTLCDNLVCPDDVPTLP